MNSRNNTNPYFVLVVALVAAAILMASAVGLLWLSWQGQWWGIIAVFISNFAGRISK